MPTQDEIAARRAGWASLAALVVAPLMAKLPLLLGVLKADPLLLYGGLHNGLRPGWLPGYPPYPTLDPNIAFTSQALGRRAALDVLSGHLPWWNHFEGVGAPLAGEMQSAALFPLTWLLILPHGQLYMHLALQVIAGVAAFALLRRLGCGRVAAVAAALAFEFNGTFAWLANAVINPIAFLPVILLGVEIARERVEEGRGGGVALIAVGLAASLYAGFPEVAYLNGLLIAAWTLVRTASLPGPAACWAFLVRVGIGAAAGVAIAAPVIIAFLDYLPLAQLGGHAGDAFAGLHIRPGYLLATLAPYAFGAPFHLPLYDDLWSNVGGYAGCMLAGHAVYGALDRSLRPLRILLAAWVALTVAFSYGLPGLDLVARIIPGIGNSAFYRYATPGWEFALCVLAGLGLTDLGAARGRAPLWAALVLTVCAAAAAWLYSRRENLPLDHFLGFLNVAGLGLLLVAAAALIALPRSRPRMVQGLAALLVVEAAAYFILPSLGWPSAGKVELGGVAYLRAHMGFQRFATVGPLAPNYGSYFGLGAVNHNDLPIPRAWTDHVGRHLDAEANPILFTGATSVDDLAARSDAYRRVGVRYVLTPPGALDTPAYAALKAVTGGPGAPYRPVYADAAVQILELSNPAAYVSAPGCTLRAETRDLIRADCAAPSVLTRLELHMAGWRASVNGVRAKVEPTGEIFQRTPLPQGASVVRFAFTPPHMAWGWAAFAAGWLTVLLSSGAAAPLRAAVPRRFDRSPRSAPPDGSGTPAA